MENSRINHAAVWVCIVVITGLGFIWYGPLFDEPWMEMVGLDLDTVMANPPGAGAWITNAIATIIPVYALAWLFTKLGVNSALKGMLYALFISFAFHFLSNMTGDMFAYRPYELSWITGGFDLVAMAVTGLILGGWRKTVPSGAPA